MQRSAFGLVLLSSLSVACGAVMRAPTAAAPMAGRMAGKMAGAGRSAYDGGADASLQLAGRAIIRRANVNVRVAEAADARVSASRLVSSMGGFVEHEAVSERNVHLSMRVPTERLEPLIDSIGRLGTIEHRSVSSEDVTAETIDLDARVKSLETSRDRLRALHERANTVEEVIAVERELARVQGELDSLKGRLDDLRKHAALSSLELSLRQKQVLGPLGLVAAGASWVVMKLFVIR